VALVTDLLAAGTLNPSLLGARAAMWRVGSGMGGRTVETTGIGSRGIGRVGGGDAKAEGSGTAIERAGAAMQKAAKRVEGIFQLCILSYNSSFSQGMVDLKRKGDLFLYAQSPSYVSVTPL
jgi:hypothetical protein